MPPKATCGGRAGSRSPAAQPSAARAAPSSSGPAGRERVGTLVSAARTVPSGAASVDTGIGPTGVSNTNAPVPALSASATAAATVAWPQNGTSASGLK